MRISTILAIISTVIFSTSCVSCNSILQPRVVTNNITYSTVFQLPNNGSWFENLIQRPNGEILTTRADVCELWAVNPYNKTGKLAVQFSNCTAAVGITQIDHDVFAVVAGKLDLSTLTVTPGSWLIYRVDFSNAKNATSGKVSLLSSLPDAEFLNGATTFSSTTILVADSVKGAIWRVNSRTGAYALAVSDPTMLAPTGSKNPVGINGVKVLDNYIYYTSTGVAKFCRIPVSRPYAEATGPVQVLATNFTMDDFIVLDDGTSFIAGDPSTFIYEVTASGNLSVAAGIEGGLEVAGTTAVKFGRLQKDRGVLYASTNGAQLGPVNGVIEPAKIVAVNMFAD